MRPIFIENSIIPKILSFLAPININAISLFPFVFSRSKIGPVTKRHETIHFQQQLETLVVGFYILYLYDYLKCKLTGKEGKKCYRQIRAENEAYDNELDENYLNIRKRWKWMIQ